MNDARARYAEAAIRAFIGAAETGREDALADLLCDLRHWCDRAAAAASTARLPTTWPRPARLEPALPGGMVEK